ncbi:LysR family transcriptional regulator [Adlercreutzia sp. ZJ242]|uniref:LysR family transcriptional regulator n=1 Tax=Adlercreutzia sp. ZJ242 TaxID=2709409 RepID=UPI0013ECF488|nr:LysR family transcriptional regulator [Adlercreutzia sp. ZJ242]
MLFDDIQVLIVLSESKSLSQAAEQLYMSRPGLSQKIATIEKKFGKKLFDRSPSGISMTPEGELVVKFARNTAELERVLASQLAAIDEHFNATIKVGMCLNDGVALLPRLVAGYLRDVQPGARVHLDAAYEPELVAKLHAGELDFALLENWPMEAGLVSEVLGYKKLIFIGPNKPPYNQVMHPLPIETLLKWPMIIYEWDSGRHMVGNRHFRERYGLSLQNHNMIACFDTHEAMVEGVRAGLGWCSIPDCIYARCKDDPDIVRFKVATAPMWYPVSLAWSSEHVLRDEARAFINYIYANLPEGYFTKDVSAYINS